jgi:hypothetical protein
MEHEAKTLKNQIMGLFAEDILHITFLKFILHSAYLEIE